MKTFVKRLLASGSLLGMFAGAVSAQSTAQFNITYTSLSGAPAPSTFVLIGIGLLFTFVAYRKMRKLPMARALAAILFVAALGVLELNKAFAVPPTTESMTGPGPLVFSLGSGQEAFVQNNTGVSQQITGITLNPNPSSLAIVTPPGTPQCVVGMTLTSGQGCYVEVEAL
jgi:hypothetical protein